MRFAGRYRSVVLLAVSMPVNKPDSRSADQHGRKIRRLRGKPLTSRSKWLTIKVLYFLGCIAGVVAVLVFTSGIWLAIGLTVMAAFVGGLFELFALSYGDYRRDWEVANSSDG